MSAKREPGVHGAKARGPAEKDRPIDPTSGKNSPASKEPEPVSEPIQADGRQPFMPQEYLTTPAFNLIPSVSLITRRMRPLSVGRFDNAFHPAINHNSMFHTMCKAIAKIRLIGKYTAEPSRWRSLVPIACEGADVGAKDQQTPGSNSPPMQRHSIDIGMKRGRPCEADPRLLRSRSVALSPRRRRRWRHSWACKRRDPYRSGPRGRACLPSCP